MVVEAAVDELITAARAVAIAEAQLLQALSRVAKASPVREFAPVEVASSLAWSRQAATAKLAFAREVLELSAVFGSLSRGEIDLPKARVFCEETRVLPPESARDVCGQLLPEAPGLTTGQLRAKLSRLVLTIDPHAAKARHREKVASRRLVFEPDRDGCAGLFALDLPADRARAAANAVHAQARMARAAGDARSMDQLRADIFLDLLSGKPSGGRGGSVELTASLRTLVHLAETPGDLAGYGPVIADIARKVASQQRNASWTFTVHDAETGDTFHGITRTRPTPPKEAAKLGGPRPGAPADRSASPGRSRGRARAASGPMFMPPLSANQTRQHPVRDSVETDYAERANSAGKADITRDRRQATAAVARIVRARDRRCRAPGCRVPASRCDLDHRQDWAHGGRTEPANLVPLCRYHHRAKHVGGWRYYRTKHGAYVWRSPLGRNYRVDPELPP
ncbi:HNH endonuclease signature motif containing protein [Catelliglobosispora koreensis]|uniref:HNH endonuclease signature motif containing protein n=1 Tax=Catelliglobosispora koreensis TaxID=129052 RepID=UPI000381B058|nr:HNH endonuclease signature motif containing protein [Catelliglobosispora koreensis]